MHACGIGVVVVFLWGIWIGACFLAVIGCAPYLLI